MKMMPPLTIGLCALLLAGCATSNKPVQKNCYHVNEAMERDIGYCSAVRVGNTLYISGVVASGEASKATKQVYQQLGKVLNAHGMNFSHVVKENVYARDLDAFIATQAERKAFYGNDFPAATWVQVERLYFPQFVLEVELIAMLPEQ